MPFLPFAPRLGGSEYAKPGMDLQQNGLQGALPRNLRDSRHDDMIVL